MMDVSPKQIISVATALIPFLEHDDANRALMGANMQRQAVPLVRSEAPYIGTGIETDCATDAGDMVLAEDDGTVLELDADHMIIDYKKLGERNIRLKRFERSNQDSLHIPKAASRGWRQGEGWPVVGRWSFNRQRRTGTR